MKRRAVRGRWFRPRPARSEGGGGRSGGRTRVADDDVLEEVRVAHRESAGTAPGCEERARLQTGAGRPRGMSNVSSPDPSVCRNFECHATSGDLTRRGPFTARRAGAPRHSTNRLPPRIISIGRDVAGGRRRDVPRVVSPSRTRTTTGASPARTRCPFSRDRGSRRTRSRARGSSRTRTARASSVPTSSCARFASSPSPRAASRCLTSASASLDAAVADGTLTHLAELEGLAPTPPTRRTTELRRVRAARLPLLRLLPTSRGATRAVRGSLNAKQATSIVDSLKELYKPRSAPWRRR